MTLDLATIAGETGLSWPELPTFEQWADLGPRIAHLGNVSRWALADWLCTGEDLFHAKADQVISELGLSYHTLENLRWVARHVPPGVRQPLPVTFSHHALVAPLEPENQELLLLECREKGWSRDQFREILVGAGMIPGASSSRRDVLIPLTERFDRILWINGVERERRALAEELAHVALRMIRP
jgi:hypothetical protein